MNGIKWQEPPGDGRASIIRPSKWTSVADALRSNPGKWALLAENVSPSLSTDIKKARSLAFAPAGSFEAVTRRQRGNKCDIYARFVGEQVSA